MRAIEPADIAALIAMNNANHVEVGFAGPGAFQGWLGVAVVATASGPIGDPDAFLIAFDHRTPPQGPNHAWFLARGGEFLYVDRVCVHPRARRRGLARALYEDLFRRAGPTLVCCEVNFDPPNPVSEAFHAALGFVEVGRAFLPDRNKSVRYLERKP